jgi:tetratricopeptide (TPR) repeat protein
MAESRNELDIQKSSGVSYRNVSIIMEEVAKAEKILSEKSKEAMTSQELKDLGITFNEKSDYTKSQEFLNAALGKVQHESLAEDKKNLLIAECYYGLANCKRELGHPDQAIDLFKKAKIQAEKISGEIKGLHDLKYVVARNVGIAYLMVEDHENAAHSFSDAVTIAESTGQTGRIPAVRSYFGLSLVLTGKAIEKGFQELEEARKLYPKNGREESMDWAAHRYHMARAFEAVNDPINALAEYAESRRLRIQIIDRSKIGSVYYHNRLGDSSAGLGRVCALLGRRSEAEKYFREALESYEALGATKKADAIRKSLFTETTSLSPSTQTTSNMFYLAPQLVNTVVSSYKTPGLRSGSEEQ